MLVFITETKAHVKNRKNKRRVLKGSLEEARARLLFFQQASYSFYIPFSVITLASWNLSSL